MAGFNPRPRFDIAMQATAKATQEMLVRVAKREHAKVMAASPRPNTFSRMVDGVGGNQPEESVKPFGRIDYFYPRFDDVAQFAMETLFAKSPVDSGDYRNSHTLFLNGSAVASLKDWKRGDEIAISNPLPYARKIELGIMEMRVSGTDRVYAQAARIVQRRYSNVAQVRFTYRGVAGGYGRDARAIERDTRQPVLLILER